MNIAMQTHSVLQGFMAGKQVPKWMETLTANQLPKWIVGVLVLIVASQAADLTWRMVPVPESVLRAPQQMIPTPSSQASKQSREEDLGTVANLHLFGVAGAGKPMSQIEKKAPETRLNLTLHGVFVDEDPEQGAAIIGKSGSTQKYYKAGAPVMNGVTLRGVFTDRVVLMRNGQSEVLRFPKVPSSGTSSRIASLPDIEPAPSPASDNASLRRFRKEFQQEPLKIFEHVRFVPVRSRDGIRGYRVLPQKNRELYNKMGIRPSDLVTAVNGVDLTDDKEAVKLMEILKNASTFQVDIVRNGQPKSLSFSLN